MRKVIIDTDIGDDIDDAFALYLAMHLKLNIIGVTTVFKNTLERSRMAKKILKLYFAALLLFLSLGDII